MAAPNNAYRNKSLWMRGGTTNYEHKTAILQEDKATMLERFYLDDLVSVKVDGTNDGVIGAVIIGGDNEKMHNITTRGGVGRVRVQGQTARLLNDAGLNTKGKSSEVPLDIELGHRSAKTGIVKFKAAYYLGSGAVDYGIRFRQTGGWQELYGDVPISPAGELSRDFKFPKLTPNASIEVQSFIRNAEGEYISNSVTSIVFTEAVMMSYDNVPYQGLCNAQKNTAVYYDVDEITIGTMFFTDSSMQVPAPSGGYSDGVNYYSYNVNSGVTDIWSCYTPPVRSGIAYINYDPNSDYMACVLDGTEGSIYYEGEGVDRVWYATNNSMDDTKAAPGFYSYIDGANRMVLHVGANGSQISIRNCNEI